VFQVQGLSDERERLCPAVNASLLERTLDEGLLAVEWLSEKQIVDMQAMLQQVHDTINHTVIAQVPVSVMIHDL
jgi:hypothetical protein